MEPAELVGQTFRLPATWRAERLMPWLRHHVRSYSALMDREEYLAPPPCLLTWATTVVLSAQGITEEGGEMEWK